MAAQRQTTADHLRRTLRGDLDRIVQTALHKEPARRYASAQALAEDVERHLDGLPVRAERDTLRYRARKFAGRHARALATAAAALAVAVGVLSWYTVRLSQARDRAEAALARSEQVTALVVDLFSGADPESGRGETLTVRQALDESLARLGQPSNDTPADVRASLLDAAGRIYTRLGLFDDARPLLQQAYRIRRELPGDHRAEVAASLFSQAELANTAGEFARADTLYRGALQIQRAALGAGHSATRSTMGQLAYNDLQAGRGLRAERLSRELLAVTREAAGPRSPELVVPLRALAHAVLQNREDTEEAERLLREATSIHRATVPADHPDGIPMLVAWATLADYQQEHEEGVGYRERARDLARSTYGPDSPLYADQLSNLVKPYFSVGRLPDAVAVAREAFAVYRAASGGGRDWNTANSAHNLACVLALSGEYAEAGRLFHRSRQTWADLEGPRSAIVANSLDQEAQLLWKPRGLLDRAGTLMRQAVAVERERTAADPDDPGNDLAIRLRNLADVYVQQERWADAERLQREVLTIYARTGGPGSRPRRTLRNVGLALVRQGQHAEAEPLLRRALPVFQRLDDQAWQEDVEGLLAEIAQRRNATTS